MEHWGPFYPPQQVVDFIKTKIIMDNVKFYDVNPDIFRALARTGIDSHHYGMVPKFRFRSGKRTSDEAYVQRSPPLIKIMKNMKIRKDLGDRNESSEI
ncbi:hypothetical protein YC2023_048874 [Brassica napus]